MRVADASCPLTARSLHYQNYVFFNNMLKIGTSVLLVY